MLANARFSTSGVLRNDINASGDVSEGENPDAWTGFRDFCAAPSPVKIHSHAVRIDEDLAAASHAIAATCCLSHKSRNALTEQISRESIYLPA